MKKTIIIYEGKIEQDGSFYNQEWNYYIGDERIKTVFNDLEGKNIRLTIEEIEE